MGCGESHRSEYEYTQLTRHQSFTKTTDNAAVASTLSVMAEVADLTEVLLRSHNGQKLATLLNTPSIVKHFKYLLVRKQLSFCSTLLTWMPFRSPTSQLNVPRLDQSRRASANVICSCHCLYPRPTRQPTLYHSSRRSSTLWTLSTKSPASRSRCVDSQRCQINLLIRLDNIDVQKTQKVAC
jgi:hypothetical protein